MKTLILGQITEFSITSKNIRYCHFIKYNFKKELLDVMFIINEYNREIQQHFLVFNGRMFRTKLDSNSKFFNNPMTTLFSIDTEFSDVDIKYPSNFNSSNPPNTSSILVIGNDSIISKLKLSI